MGSDEQQLVGKWSLTFRGREGTWKWEYTFSADGSVKWRDPHNNMTGSGRWMKHGEIIYIIWSDSTTKERWYCPINPTDQKVLIDASYGIGQSSAQKMGASAKPPPGPTPSGPETTTVWYYLNRELAAYATLPEYDRLWGAAWGLKSERNRKGPDGKPINCGNKPLSYAEHYMLARAFVASGGSLPLRMLLWKIASVLVITYDLGKLAYYLSAALSKAAGPGPYAAIQKRLLGFVYHLGDCPSSGKPPDPQSTCWGLLGARHGLEPLK